MQLYHGTTQEFKRFDPKRLGQRDSGNLGIGVYLTSNAQMARSYAEDNTKRFGGTPTVLDVDARLSKTADFGKLIPTLKAELGIEFPPRANQPKRSAAITKWMQAQGYDSARAGDEYVVYDLSKLRVKGIAKVPSRQEYIQALLKKKRAELAKRRQEAVMGTLTEALCKRLGEAKRKVIPCPRCLGKGEIRAYRRILGGICFRCHGTGKTLSSGRGPSKYEPEPLEKANNEALQDAADQAERVMDWRKAEKLYLQIAKRFDDAGCPKAAKQNRVNSAKARKAWHDRERWAEPTHKVNVKFIELAAKQSKERGMWGRAAEFYLKIAKRYEDGNCPRTADTYRKKAEQARKKAR